MSHHQRLHRSALFVPGSEQRRIEKSAGIPADLIIFDLEDAVSPAKKSTARQLVADALKASEFEGQQLVVRVNGLSSPWFNEDMAAITEVGNCSVMLPKFESPDDIAELRKFTEKDGLPLLGIIETALGVLTVAEAAKSLSKSDILCFGHADFAADMELDHADPSQGVIHHARCQVVLAARAYGVSALDNVCLEVRDEAVLREDILLGISLGYSGKMCIHPRQVEIANALYTPSDEQVSNAKEILEGWAEAQKQGLGVFAHKNKMVDLPVILAQERIVARAEMIAAKS